MYVLCMEPGEVLCLTLEGREQLSLGLHKMEHFFRIKLTNGYIALQQRIISLLSHNPQQRYEEFSPARALYEKMGWKQDQDYLHYYCTA